MASEEGRSQIWCQLPNELWALVLSKLTWRGSWCQAKVLLFWRRGAASALQVQPQLLAQLVFGNAACHSVDLCHNALLKAARRGRADVAAALLEQHPKWDADQCESALYHAAEAGHVGMVQLLLNHIGASDAADTDAQETASFALCRAAKEGQQLVVEALLAAGADVDYSDGSPLRFAAAHNHTASVALLLAAGADMHVGMHHGSTMPLSLAVEHGHMRVAEVLLDAGARVTDIELYSLHTTVRKGCVGMLELLLARGLELTHVREQMLAEAAGHGSVVRLLRQRRVRTRAASRRWDALMASQVG